MKSSIQISTNITNLASSGNIAYLQNMKRQETVIWDFAQFGRIKYGEHGPDETTEHLLIVQINIQNKVLGLTENQKCFININVSPEHYALPKDMFQSTTIERSNLTIHAMDFERRQHLFVPVPMYNLDHQAVVDKCQEMDTHSQSLTYMSDRELMYLSRLVYESGFHFTPVWVYTGFKRNQLQEEVSSIQFIYLCMDIKEIL